MLRFASSSLSAYLVSLLAVTIVAGPPGTGEAGARPVPRLERTRALPVTATREHGVDPWDGRSELDAEALVAAVLARNPSLAAAEEAWQAATQRVPQTTALDDPRFGYTIGPDTVGNPRLDLGQRIDVSQALPWPGKLAARGEAARHEAEAAGDDVETARLRLVEAAREAFYDWWYAHRAIGINEATRRLLAELRDVAETRYAAGLASKQDALAAEVEHQHLVHQEVILERMRDVALARMNRLLNRPPGARIPSPVSVVPHPRPLPPPTRLEAEAVERRPALRAELRRIEARKADLHLARLEYFPDFTVMAAYDAFWEADELRPMVGFAINVPIRLERRRAALDEARANLRRAELLFEEKKAEVLFEVSRTAHELREEEHVVRLYGASIIPAAEESFAAARSGYESATNDFLALIEAERALLAAELAHAQGLAAYHKARARLERAVGAPLDELEEIR